MLCSSANASSTSSVDAKQSPKLNAMPKHARIASPLCVSRSKAKNVHSPKPRLQFSLDKKRHNSTRRRCHRGQLVYASTVRPKATARRLSSLTDVCLPQLSSCANTANFHPSSTPPSQTVGSSLFLQARRRRLKRCKSTHCCNIPCMRCCLKSVCCCCLSSVLSVRVHESMRIDSTL
jgi:hypothetical protein